MKDGTCPISSLSLESSNSSFWDTTEIDTEYIMSVRYSDGVVGLRREIFALEHSELKRFTEDLISRLNNDITKMTDGAVTLGEPSVKLDIVDRQERNVEEDDFALDSENKLDSRAVAFRKITVTGDFSTTDSLEELVATHCGEAGGYAKLNGISVHFCDFSSVEPVYFEYTVHTTKPHQYYRNVESVEEFVDKSKNHETRNGLYIIERRVDLDKDQEELTEIERRISQESKEIMLNVLSNLDVDNNHTFEAEQFSINEDKQRFIFFLRQDVSEYIV